MPVLFVSNERRQRAFSTVVAPFVDVTVKVDTSTKADRVVCRLRSLPLKFA